MTWAKIRAAALDSAHPLINEVEGAVMCPECRTWHPESHYRHYRLPLMPDYYPYLVVIRRCPKPDCDFLFAMVT